MRLAALVASASLASAAKEAERSARRSPTLCQTSRSRSVGGHATAALAGDGAPAWAGAATDVEGKARSWRGVPSSSARPRRGSRAPRVSCGRARRYRGSHSSIEQRPADEIEDRAEERDEQITQRAWSLRATIQGDQRHRAKGHQLQRDVQFAFAVVWGVIVVESHVFPSNTALPCKSQMVFTLGGQFRYSAALVSFCSA